MKAFVIGNCIYLPLSKSFSTPMSQKYIKGGISGELSPEAIMTEEEIKEEWKHHKGLREVQDLHELIKVWGSK